MEERKMFRLLVFIFFSALASSVAANICIPDKENLFKVVGVADDDELNVRSGWATKYPVLFELQPDAKDIYYINHAYKSDVCLALCRSYLKGEKSLETIIAEECRNKNEIWYNIALEDGQSGWTSGKYLKEYDPTLPSNEDQKAIKAEENLKTVEGIVETCDVGEELKALFYCKSSDLCTPVFAAEECRFAKEYEKETGDKPIFGTLDWLNWNEKREKEKRKRERQQAERVAKAAVEKQFCKNAQSSDFWKRFSFLRDKPINILGIDMSLTKNEAKKVLECKNYFCQNKKSIWGVQQLVCSKGRAEVTISGASLSFNCASLEVCGLSGDEIATELIKAGKAFSMVPSVQYMEDIQVLKYCDRGRAGDILCVEENEFLKAFGGGALVTIDKGNLGKAKPTFD